MAGRFAMRRKARSPYGGRLFNCAPGCGCPDCSMRAPRVSSRVLVALSGLAAIVSVLALIARAS